VRRTDKKQHFSEKVSKVESILAADGKSVEKKVMVTETVQKGAGEPAAAAPAAVEQRQDQPGISTHKGTWASMFSK
jgi:hypothetical protein